MKAITFLIVFLLFFVAVGGFAAAPDCSDGASFQLEMSLPSPAFHLHFDKDGKLKINGCQASVHDLEQVVEASFGSAASLNILISSEQSLEMPKDVLLLIDKPQINMFAIPTYGPNPSAM